MKPNCIHCGSNNVRIFDNERLETPDKATDHIDSEIYAMLMCDDCHQITHIVGDITWRKPTGDPVTWTFALSQVHDTSGIDHPERYMYRKIDGIYFPILSTYKES